ncbi:hypothetical protein ACI780_07260 [Geodermatophilus sp. SYSU D00814]
MPAVGDLVECTLAFSGSYVSDDGSVTIRRSVRDSVEYSGRQFAAYCRRCARARLMPSGGEILPDVRAAIVFAATHDHDDLD